MGAETKEQKFGSRKVYPLFSIQNRKTRIPQKKIVNCSKASGLFVLRASAGRKNNRVLFFYAFY
jgi:hypothetical protein